jgi:hypothetical protein
LLGGYTLLIALTGWAIVRFGQVWDDARTILLIVVFLELALSNCFDQVALKDPRAGAAFLLAGLCFSIGTSEGFLRALGIRLSLSFRMPAYSLLGLFFVHPIWLAFLSVHGRNTAMTWGVYLFAWLASVFLIMFLPAAHRQDDRMPSGTPWRWPWYPWSVMAVLLLGLLLRSYSLSMAFEPTRGTATSWRAYFVVPIALAALALVLELAHAARHRLPARIAMAAPIGLLLLSFPGQGNNTVDARFLQMLCTAAGSPVQITLAGLLAFYLVAWLRGMRVAEGGVLVSLAFLALVDDRSLDLRSIRPPNTLAIEALAVIQLGIGLWTTSSWRVLVGVLLGITSLSIRGHDTWFTAEYGFYPLHLAAVFTLVVGFMFNDTTAFAIRRIAWRVIPIAALAAAFGYDLLFPGVPAYVRLSYVGVLTVGSSVGWYLAPTVPQLGAVLLTTSANVVAQARPLYLVVAASELGRALPFLAWGFAFLGVAAAISLWKGGILRRFRSKLQQVNDVVSARASCESASTEPLQSA